MAIESGISVTEKPHYDNNILLSVFDIAKDWTVELNSNITDYYTENNTPVQDHIALAPKRITVSGYQGELVTRTEHTSSLGLTALKKGQIWAGIQENVKNVNIQAVAQKLDVLNPLNPLLPPQVAQVRAKISRATDAFDKYRSLINQDWDKAYKAYTSSKNFIEGFKRPKLRGKAIIDYPEGLGMDRQHAAFDKFHYLWQQKILCFVDTPWGKFENMAIESVTFTQDEESKYISDISVTFKKMQFTSPKYEKFDSKNFASPTASSQHAEMAEMGKTQGKTPDKSILVKVMSGEIHLPTLAGY